MRIGIVGGGQLAMMMSDASDGLDLDVTALASRADDPIFSRVPQALVGDARSAEDLRRLADQTDVLTFDHELVDVVVVAQLEHDGIICRPGSRTLAFATDKQRQWELFNELGLAQPDTIVVNDVEAALKAIASFDGSAVLKMATGGYDGRGVLLDADEHSVREWFPADSATASTPTTVLVQRSVAIDDELAVQVVRATDGSIVTYAPVRTVQADGMCSVVHVPAEIDAELEATACQIARTIADAIGAVGILTVEFFVADGQLVVNELAARPHNSGHLTIEASRTSQFENHLRAVAGFPLGSTELIVPAAAMANIVGRVASTQSASSPPVGVAVHLYGKAPRPGRKIGHVTAVAESPDKAVALALGTATEIENGAVTS